MRIKSAKAAHPGVTIEILRITPEVARWMLGFNQDNRAVRKMAVGSLVRSIVAGSWALNGSTISFAGPKSNPTRLLDGQHRLTAVIESGEPVDMIVVWDLDSEAQLTMDIGPKRTTADFLGMSSEVNSNVLSGAITITWRTEHAERSGSARPTPTEAFDVLERNPGLRESVTFVRRGAKLRYSPSLAAALHYIFASIDREDADKFWTMVLQNVGLVPNTGPCRLHDQVREASERRDVVIPQAALHKITIKAWNAFRDGVEVKQRLKAPETWPEPK